ncbi:MAG TPA: hypothetical protein VF026_09760 [Ktedonobacteraceae bacterium]
MHLTTMLSSLPPLPRSPEATSTGLQGCIGWVGSSSVPAAPGVGWEQLCFDKPIQFVQVDIGKHGAQDAALRAPAQRGMIAPVFQVACLKEGFDEPHKATIMDFLSQDGQQDLMIETVKRSYNLLPYSTTRMKKIQ